LNDNPTHQTTARGYLEVNGQLRPLPIGSTMNAGTAIFTWQPGPGFLGKYRLVFGLQTNDNQVMKKIVKITINPAN
jgi:hypothetical protein